MIKYWFLFILSQERERHRLSIFCLTLISQIKLFALTLTASLSPPKINVG